MPYLLLILAGIPVLAALSGLLYQIVATARDRRRYRPPGRLVDVDGTRLHLAEMGKGDPAVILDSALGGSSMSWYQIQPELARFTRACAYDRAGFGWSDPATRARTALDMTEELRGLLVAAAIPPPFVLAGHSYGSLVCLLFAARYPGEVGGLVLVDPPDIDSWSRPDERQSARIERGARLARGAAVASRFGLTRLFFYLSSLGATRLISGGRIRPDENGLFRILQKLPSESRAVLRWFWSESRSLAALASQIENVPVSALAVASVELSPDLPLAVLTAADAPAAQREFHERLAARSTRGRHVVAAHSGHWIPIDEPELVVEACRQVVAAVRETG